MSWMITEYPQVCFGLFLLVTIAISGNTALGRRFAWGLWRFIQETALTHQPLKKQSRLCIFKRKITSLMMVLDKYTVKVSFVGAGSMKVRNNKNGMFFSKVYNRGVHLLSYVHVKAKNKLNFEVFSLVQIGSVCWSRAETILVLVFQVILLDGAWGFFKVVSSGEISGPHTLCYFAKRTKFSTFKMC